jgi:hypothetical protein
VQWNTFTLSLQNLWRIRSRSFVGSKTKRGKHLNYIKTDIFKFVWENYS